MPATTDRQSLYSALNEGIREVSALGDLSDGELQGLYALYGDGAPRVDRLRIVTHVLPFMLDQASEVMDVLPNLSESTIDRDVLVRAAERWSACQAIGLGNIAVDVLVDTGVMKSMPVQVREAQRRRYDMLAAERPGVMRILIGGMVVRSNQIEGFERTPDSIVIMEGPLGLAALVESTPVKRNSDGIITGIEGGGSTMFYDWGSRESTLLTEWYDSLLPKSIPMRLDT